MLIVRRDIFSLFLCAALLFIITAVPAFSLAPAQAATFDEGDDLFAPPPVASAKKALLTLFYNGETTGELHPCPT